VRRGPRPTVTRVGSGIIYAVIIVMWAAYFIPRWLKRHEELSESRSVEKFDHAMRILSRKDATPDQREVVMPRRPAAPKRTLPARTPLPSQGATVRRTRRGRRPISAAVRRRRILAGLLLSTFVATVLAPLTPLPWWAPVALLVLTLADIAHLRAQVRSSREVTRSREAVRRSMRSRLTRFDALDKLMSVRRELAEERAAENARWAAAEEAERRVREEEERQAAVAAGRWDPVPVPLPTYVSKPPAPRRAPPIDLAHQEAWSEAQLAGARVVDETPATPPATSGMSALVADAEDADDQLEAIIHRRAVND
jgi:hypothetical protein